VGSVIRRKSQIFELVLFLNNVFDFCDVCVCLRTLLKYLEDKTHNCMCKKT
jgi:hypothetical protein